MPSSELLRFSAPVTVTGEPTSLWDVIGFRCHLLAEADLNNLRTLAKLNGRWSVTDAEIALGRSRAEVVNSLVLLTRLGLIRRRYEGQELQLELLNLVREFVAVSQAVAPTPESVNR